MKFIKNPEKKYSPLNQALRDYLPELMLRNIKKGERLKSKIDVNFFLNNVELRNQSYLKKLVTSSEKNLQSIKSGLEMKKAIELTEEKLSPLNLQILDDYFLRKNNVISGAKRLLVKNTEEESNIIIKDSLHMIKHFLNPTNIIIEEPKKETPKKKLMTKNELFEAEEVINQKLKNDVKNLNSRVNKYLDRVQKIKLTMPRNDNKYDPKWIKANRDKNKDFYFYADNFKLNNHNIKMIHYKKLEPIPIRDKSCPNLKDMKEKLFPEIKEGTINKDDVINIKNCNSVKIVNDMQIQKKYKEKKLSLQNNKTNDIDINDIKIKENKNDSYNTLNRIVRRNKSLANISNKRYKKLSSLMDIELPKLFEYDYLMNKRQTIISEQDNNKNNEIEETNDINYSRKNSSKLISICSKWKLMPEITELKKEIDQLKTRKIDIEQNYQKHKDDMNQKTYLIQNNLPKRKRPKRNKSLRLLNNDSLFSLNNKNNKSININISSAYERNSIRMPSSYSVQVLKRKSRINSGIQIIQDKKIFREFSNFSREGTTNMSTNNPSIRNSAASSITINNKNKRRFDEILKILKRDKNKNKIEQPIFSLKKMKINLFSNNTNIGTNNSSNI